MPIVKGQNFVLIKGKLPKRRAGEGAGSRTRNRESQTDRIQTKSMASEGTEARACLNCGNEIAGEGADTKFCSRSCKLEWLSRHDEVILDKYIRICEYCGEPYLAMPQGERRYCCRACFQSARNLQKLCGASDYGLETAEREVSEEEKSAYAQNPYVRYAGAGRIVFTESFYRDAHTLAEAGADRILEAFEVKPELLTERAKAQMMTRLSKWTPTDSKPEETKGRTAQELRILARRMKLMESLVTDVLKEIGGQVKDMAPWERKDLCRTIRDFPEDPMGVFSLNNILALTGISHTSYYNYIGKENYGLSIEERDARDEGIVRRAFEYKGYRKGARMVYMLIPKLNGGKKIGLDRVRRIMKNYGMVSGIRQPNPHRQAGRKMMERRKPNLLMRMFRLHRPNEVRVTDVTYMDYCKGRKRAYGSALLDPVTNVLVAFVVSDKNNQDLAMETLRQNDKHPCKEGGVFHTDQGALYLSPEFQAEVERLGFRQSMSKRGNCWDNAVAESFFGVCKSEVDLSQCETLEELRSVIAGYADYYNRERGLWEKKQMTPLEYEEYLNSLTDKEFAEYMAREAERYEQMKEEAARKAKERYKTLGV